MFKKLSSRGISSREPFLLIDAIRGIAKNLKHQGKEVDPTTLYENTLKTGKLKSDDFQRQTVVQLTKLYNDINRQRFPIHSAPVKSEKVIETSQANRAGGSSFGLLGKLFAPSEKAYRQVDMVYNVETKDGSEDTLTDPSIKGAYLWGDVGCGKTLLMDLFHTCFVVNGEIRGIKRIHFNKFMLDFHKRMHLLKKDNAKNNIYAADLVGPLAQELAKEAWILCFDEFQVVDIADAMILKRLFFELWKNGTICIITGNRKPEDLYKNGLQYKNFQPFIPLLLQHITQDHMNSGIDYRRKEIASHGESFYLSTLPDSNKKFTQKLLETAKISSVDKLKPKELFVFGRKLKIERTNGRVALFTFSELCEAPLAAQDYLEIASTFDVIFIRDIKRMDLQTQRAEARRWISLIDQLYDHQTGVVYLAEEMPENIFYVKDEVRTEFSHEERLFMDDLQIQGTKAAEALSIISGEEEAFALKRMISRLYDMKTQDYWDNVSRRVRDSNDQ